MTTTFDQFSVAQEKTLAKLSELTAIGTSTSSKLMELNMATLKDNSSKVAETAVTFAKLKDMSSIGELQATVQPNVDMVKDYWKASMDIASASSAEVSKIFEESVNDTNATISENLDTLEKNAYPGAPILASTIKSVMAFANQAFDTTAKAQKQTQDAVNTTMTSATKTTSRTKKKT